MSRDIIEGALGLEALCVRGRQPPRINISQG
jgi:hypothetical protein